MRNERVFQINVVFNENEAVWFTEVSLLLRNSEIHGIRNWSRGLQFSGEGDVGHSFNSFNSYTRNPLFIIDPGDSRTKK